MPKTIAIFFLIAFLAAANAVAEQKKLVVVGGVDYAFKNLSLDVGGPQKLTAPLSTVSPNIALSYGNFYTSLVYDGAVAPGTAMFIDGGEPQVLSMSRSDISLTFGYRLADPVNIFAGWLNSNIDAVQSGFADDGGTPNWFVQDVQYSTQGAFLGASYTMAVGKRSSLNLSAAYAKLAGTFVKSQLFSGGSPTVSSSSFDVAGLSYGLTFSGELTGSVGYRVGLKNTRYASDPTIANPGGIVEQYTSFFFGVSNYF